jgi:WD40 repeat protein
MDRDAEIERLLAGYLEAAEAGTAPPPAEWIDRHSEYRAELAEFFALRRDIEKLATPIRTPATPRTDDRTRLPLRFGRYTLLGVLGCGGMGVVYRARLDDPAREVALKMIRAGRFATAADRARFRTEAEAATRLNHPGVVPVYDVGEVEGQAYYTMRLLAGGDLAGRREHLAASPAAAAGVVRDVAAAIHHAHQNGVLHRDLKPSNILFDEAGRAHVSDFGLAKLAGPPADLTRTGEFLGTPEYMSPEQAAGKPATVAADVYGLGCLLYSALTGRPPLGGSDPAVVLDRVRAADPAPPGRSNPLVPRDLEAVCLRCLEKDPGRRYPSAAALADDLDRFLSGQPVRARPVGTWVRAVRWARRRPALAALVTVTAAAALALLAGAAAYSARLREHNADLEAAAGRERREADEARRQQALAEGRERQVRWQAYASGLRAGGRLWEDGQPGLLGEYLNQLRPGAGKEDLRGFEWHYLWRQGRGMRHLRGHQGSVGAVAFSRDGRVCASGGTDGAVKVWDAATGELRATLVGHTMGVGTLAFSPDGRWLASGAGGGAPVPEGRGELKLWDVATGREEADLGGNAGPVRSVAFAPDGRSLLAWGDVRDGDAEVRVWDLDPVRERPPAVRRAGRERGVTAGAMSADGRLLAVAYFLPDEEPIKNIEFRVFDRAGGREVAFTTGHQSFIWSLAFSPDGRMVAAGSLDGTITVWDVATGGGLARVRGHGGGIRSLCFSPDGRTLASGEDREPKTGAGGAVVLWDVANWARPTTGPRPDTGINAVAFAPDARTLALGCEDRLVRLWSPAGVGRCDVLPGHTPAEAWGVAFARGGRALASAGDDHLVKVWGLGPAGPRAADLRGHTSLVSCVAASGDGRLLASGDYHNVVRLWDAATGEPRAVLRGHPGPLRCVAFSPDGRRLASGCKGGVLTVWDTATGEAVRSLGGAEGQVRCAAFSADGRLLATGGQEGRVRVYGSATGRPVRVLDTPSPVFCLAFVGEELLTGHQDGVLRVWDAAGGASRPALLGHTGEVRSVAVTPDGRTLASGGADRTVRLWHAATGLELLNLGPQPAEVNGLAFSPDSRRLAAALHDGKVTIWTASPARPGDTAE